MADHVFKSKLSDVEIPEVPLTEYVLGSLPAEADARTALVDVASGRELTFGALKAGVRRMGAGLAAMGFKKGDCFALFAPNLPEYATAFHGVASVGGIVTTVNPVYTAEELNHQLNNADAQYLLTLPVFLEKAKAGAAGTGVKKIFVFGDAPDGDDSVGTFAQLLDNDGSGFPDVQIDPKKDVVALPYSSGTTGLSKGVQLTHYNLVANLCQLLHEDLIGGAKGMGPDDTLVGLLPFMHIYAMVVILNAALRAQSRVAVLQKFDPAEFLGTLQKYKVTIAHIVPPIVLFLAKHPVVDKFDLSSLREIFSGAAPLGADLSEQVVKRLKLDVLRQGYGMTEMSPASHVSPRVGSKYGSAGILVPNCTAKIVDPASGKALGPGEEGELWVRGPNIMKGYLKNDEATANTIDADQYLHTGDLGVIDEEGHLTITGRLKELIKTKGFQVAPAELEDVLTAHPKIGDVAIIGLPHERFGEAPKAFIVKKDASLTDEEVHAHMKEHLAPYKALSGGIEYIDAIPKSAAGKILRRVLHDREKAAAAAAKAEAEA